MKQEKIIVPKDLLLEMYQKMKSIRRFEEEAIQLYRQGHIYGYFHPYIGQEAIAVGSCATIRKDDYIISTHLWLTQLIEAGIHLRHTGQANVWFADGHVEACGPSRLRECGATAWIEKDYTEHTE